MPQTACYFVGTRQQRIEQRLCLGGALTSPEFAYFPAHTRVFLAMSPGRQDDALRTAPTVLRALAEIDSHERCRMRTKAKATRKLPDAQLFVDRRITAWNALERFGTPDRR